jgi:hypothetical protein
MKWKFLPIIFLGFTPILQAQQGLIVSKGMVVSAREEASQIGVDIMKKGSNGFDTMMASELALRDKNYQNFASSRLCEQKKYSKLAFSQKPCSKNSFSKLKAALLGRKPN